MVEANVWCCGCWEIPLHGWLVRVNQLLMLAVELYTSYTSCFNEVERGVYWLHVICPSVRPSVRPSVDKMVSALYLPQYYPDPFHICTFNQATSEGVLRVKVIAKFQYSNFWQVFEICNFDFVFLWYGIWYESIVWVIMGQQGVFSERSRSSCSSYIRPLACFATVYCLSIFENIILTIVWLNFLVIYPTKMSL